MWRLYAFTTTVGVRVCACERAIFVLQCVEREREREAGEGRGRGEGEGDGGRGRGRGVRERRMFAREERERKKLI